MSHTSPRNAHFIVIHGDPGTGKSLNSEALRKHYRCDEIIDDIITIPQIQKTKNKDLEITRVLLTMSTDRMKDFRRAGKLHTAQCISIETAAKALGDTWTTPTTK